VNKSACLPDIFSGGGSADSIGASLPEGLDPESLMKVLKNPEMAALLQALAKSMG